MVVVVSQRREHAMRPKRHTGGWAAQAKLHASTTHRRRLRRLGSSTTKMAYHDSRKRARAHAYILAQQHTLFHRPGMHASRLHFERRRTSCTSMTPI